MSKPFRGLSRYHLYQKKPEADMGRMGRKAVPKPFPVFSKAPL